MSTRCRIGIEQPDGTIKSIYCHHDGYYEGVGTVLQKYYDTPEKINELMELGDISCLGKKYDQEMSTLDWHRYDKDLTAEQRKKVEENIKGFNYTIAYKDRGDESPARIDNGEEEWIGLLGKCWEEFAYLYKKDYDGKYKWYATKVPLLIPLEWKLSLDKQEG